MNKNMFEGKFIVLDGPDGCGKSTQTKLLAEHIEGLGTRTVTYRDPGTTKIGEKIREILLDTANSEMETCTELLLYMAARMQLWHEQIQPALAKKYCVILDRWISSSCAYQGFAGGFGTDNVIKIAESCLAKPWPNITIILDIDLATAAPRLNATLDRMEQKGDGYHTKVRQGFLTLADGNPDFAIVNAKADIKTISENIFAIVSEKLR